MRLSEINEQLNAVEELKKVWGTTKAFDLGYQERISDLNLAICKEKKVSLLGIKELPSDTELISKSVVKNRKELTRYLCACTDQMLD